VSIAEPVSEGDDRIVLIDGQRHGKEPVELAHREVGEREALGRRGVFAVGLTVQDDDLALRTPPNLRYAERAVNRDAGN